MVTKKSFQVSTTSTTKIASSLGDIPKAIYRVTTSGGVVTTPIKGVYIGGPNLSGFLKIWPPIGNMIICLYVILWKSVLIIRISNFLTESTDGSNPTDAISLPYIYDNESGWSIDLANMPYTSYTISCSKLPSFAASEANTAINSLTAYTNKDVTFMGTIVAPSDINLYIPDYRSGYDHLLSVNTSSWNLYGSRLVTYIDMPSNASYTHVLVVIMDGLYIDGSSTQFYSSVIVTSEYKSASYGYIPLTGLYGVSGIYTDSGVKTIATSLNLSHIYHVDMLGLPGYPQQLTGRGNDVRYSILTSTDGTNFYHPYQWSSYITSPTNASNNYALITSGVLRISIKSGINVSFAPAD